MTNAYCVKLRTTTGGVIFIKSFFVVSVEQNKGEAVKVCLDLCDQPRYVFVTGNIDDIVEALFPPEEHPFDRPEFRSD